MITIRRVVGESMLPTLQPGRIVIGFRRRRINIGDIVIADIDGREVIKRVKSITNDSMFLVGDNLHASTDSRHYGQVSKATIKSVIMKGLYGTKNRPSSS